MHLLSTPSSEQPEGGFSRSGCGSRNVFREPLGGAAHWQDIFKENLHISSLHTLAILLHTVCWKLSEEHILLSVSSWGFHSYSSFQRGAIWNARQRAAIAGQRSLSEGRCPKKGLRWGSVWAVITNLMTRAFSDETVFAPKLFLVQCFRSFFFLVDCCAHSGLSVVCLSTDGFSSKHQCDTCRTLQCGTLFVSSIFGR